MNEKAEPRRRSWFRWLFAAAAVLYVLAALGSTAFLHAFADTGPIGLLLVFGPRWPAAAAGVVLILVALALRNFRWAGVLGVAELVVWFGFMGFNLPSLFSQPGEADGDTKFRVVQYNIQSASPSEPWLQELVADLEPDVLAMVECRPPEDFSPPDGYHFGKSYTLCLLSKFPINRVDARDQADAFERYGFAGITLFELEGPTGPFELMVVHLATPRSGIEALRHERLAGFDEVEKNIELRQWESGLARKWLKRAKARTLVVGDLNLPVESAIYTQNWGDLDNAFSECGFGFGNTKHTRKFGVRIDHVLMSDAFACDDAYVDSRKGSDHRPLVVDLRLRAEAEE